MSGDTKHTDGGGEKHSAEVPSQQKSHTPSDMTTAAISKADQTCNEHVMSFQGMSPEAVKAMNKKLLRKIDIRLLPFLIVMYLLNFLDRSNLAQARQGSLEADLGMGSTDFNLATSIFFVGYLLMQLPSNMLITRLRPSYYLTGAMMLWGGVSACNAATHNLSQLVVVRFFLGFVEAPFFPGAVFLMSSWYTRAELTRRMSYFYSGNALANMFGGIIGAAVLGNMDGAQGIAGWRWLFIIEGVITIGVAFIAAFVLPDYPATTRWLSEEERQFAAWRLLADINESDEQRARTVWDGVKLAVTDYRLWLFVLLQHLSLLSQTFQYFFPSIVATLGYGKIESLWLTVPVWFATFLISVCVTWTSARTEDRAIHIFCLMLVAAVGNAIATATISTGARFFAMFLMPMGAVSAYQIIVAWIANSFPRPLVKRSASLAIANMIGNTASIYGSYMYPASAAPQYVPGGSTNTVVCVLVGALALALRFLHKRINRKLEEAEVEDANNAAAGISETTDIDRRAVGFRYVY
ncbi:major facilitator superfamily domain-containing protein [Podospora didyma]|uniref:Major facilitator superfamily domain-containing protein n=1 Tax=Podospora didyma TaxID=330526 RepID=A0AAE0NS56_9PEZI|nr:major facilitator superfamily domain-containing protein [Podospora didyma]